jgi:uncharacterized protein (TIGR02646 family)
MKQIHKQTEPEEFANWKTENETKINEAIANNISGEDLWGFLPSSLSKDVVINDYCKAQLREVLVKEQYYICCYCNDSIKGEALDTKIEHFLPKETHKDKAFHYPNLLASCNGGERQNSVVLSCDSIKGKKNPLDNDIISPFDVDAHLHFSYKENGKIEGKTEHGKNTVTFLNLDCKRLQLRRKAVIEEYIYDETKEIAELISEVSEVNNGKLQAFCMAIIDVLESYR